MPWKSGARIGTPLVLAALELIHPAEVTADTSWVALHLLLIVGYVLLAWTLWPRALFPRVLLCAFGASNAAYLTVEGVFLQTGPPVTTLANATGAAWCAALLSVAATRMSVRWVPAALALVWLAFIASSVVGVGTLASRTLALGTGAVVVYTRGTRAVPFGLLVFAAVLRQHVGPEAALGMLLIAMAHSMRARERSAPAASFLP
jgi:hypothetical protein